MEEERSWYQARQRLKSDKKRRKRQDIQIQRHPVKTSEHRHKKTEADG